VMTRCGLIAAIAYFFSQQLVEIYPITADLTEWYSSGTFVALGSISALAAYGFYTSTIRRSLLRRPLQGQQAVE